VTYFPPTILVGGNLSVNVTVFATVDHTKNVTTPITVGSFSSLLNGTYVLQVQGSDSNTLPYQSTGIFVLDGNGNITSGQQTLNSAYGLSSTYTVQDPSVAPSTYSIGQDGRGTMTLNLEQTGTGTTNPETLTFTVLSSARAMVSELDSNSGSGTLELQDATAAGTKPTGAYAFVTGGIDSGNNLLGTPVPTAFGGVFNIDNPSAGSISGTGSIADQDYYDPSFSTRKLFSCVPPAGLTGTVSQPVATGVVTITLNGPICFGQSVPGGTIQFTGYIVDSTHIRLIETDDLDGFSGFLTAGIAVSQGSAAGTFTNASVNGAYVFGVLGYDVNLGTVPGSFTSAGVVKPNGGGTLTGITDSFFLGTFAAFTANPLTGKYVTDTTQIGRVKLSPKFTGASPAPSVALLFYLTGNGTPPLVLWSEGADVNYPAVATGIAYPQAASASTLTFGNPEDYGFTLTENNGSEIDTGGNMLTSVNGGSGTITGMAEDFNNNEFNGGAAFPLTDTFSLPADKFGRISGTFENMSGNVGPLFEYYMVDNNHGFFEETDMFDTYQLGLGYFEQACDVTDITSCQAAASQSSARDQRRTGSRGSTGSSKIAVH
jgi:hypothetical protein